jgi:hypothetical protein
MRPVHTCGAITGTLHYTRAIKDYCTMYVDGLRCAEKQNLYTKWKSFCLQVHMYVVAEKNQNGVCVAFIKVSYRKKLFLMIFYDYV